MMRYRPEGERVVVVNPYEPPGEHVVLARNLGDDPLLSGPLARLELRSGIYDADKRGGTEPIISPRVLATHVAAMEDLKVGEEVLFSLNAQNTANYIVRLSDASVRDMLAAVLLTNGLGFAVVLIEEDGEDPGRAISFADRIGPLAEMLMVNMVDVLVYGLKDGRHVSLKEVRGEV